METEKTSLLDGEEKDTEDDYHQKELKCFIKTLKCINILKEILIILESTQMKNEGNFVIMIQIFFC
mgnify:CR=1 FL=1